MKTDIATLPKDQAELLELAMTADNALGRVDFQYLLAEILGYAHIEEFTFFKDPRVQEHLARTSELVKDWQLHRLEQQNFRRILDFQPRETCKSSTKAEPLPVFAHVNNSEIAVGVMSATLDMARKRANAIRALWDGEDPNSILTDVYGAFRPSDNRRSWQVDKMVTGKRQTLGKADPTLAAFSTSSGPTSGHFDLFIWDDPITEETMEKDAEFLDKVWSAYTRMRYVVKPTGLLYIIGTRYHDNDLVGRIIKEEIEPAVRAAYDGKLPPDFDYDYGWVKYGHLAGWEVFYDRVYDNYDHESGRGNVVFPVCWPEVRIEDSRKTDEGRRKFWYHLMNAPHKREDAALTKEQIDRCLCAMDDVPAAAFNTIDIHCDFAFKDDTAYIKQTGDWGVAHVCAKHAGKVYRIDGFRGKLKQQDFGNELMKLIARVQYDYGSHVRYITYETAIGHGSGDESTRLWLHQLFSANPDIRRRPVPKPIRRYRGAKRSKLARILDTAWAWEEQYVQLVEGAPDLAPLRYQMENLGYTPHDDDADAFADAFHEDIYQLPPILDTGDDDIPWEDVWKPAILPVDDDDWEEDDFRHVWHLN